MASLVSKGKNKWELRINAGYDQNGKQIRFTKTVYCETKKQAKHLLAEFEIENGRTNSQDEREHYHASRAW